MLYSKERFVEDCLGELGVIASGENPSAADSASVKNALQQVESMLLTEGLKDWHYGDGRIPDMKFRPLIYLVANEVKGLFGVSTEKSMMYSAKAEKSLGDLRRQVEDYESEPVKFSNL